MNRRRQRLVFVLPVLILLLALPQVSLGEACPGTNANYHEGIARDGGTDLIWRGSEAQIEQRTVTACTANGSFSVAFVMLFDGYANPPVGYAQIGLFRNDDNGGCHCERFFWEWSETGSGFARALWGNPSATSDYGFQANWYLTDEKIHLRYDTNDDGAWEVPPNNGGGYEPVTPFSPGTAWNYSIPYYAEEIDYSGSPYKGTDADKTDFYQMMMRQSDTGNWINTDLVSGPTKWTWISDLSNKGFHLEVNNTFVKIYN